MAVEHSAQRPARFDFKSRRPQEAHSVMASFFEPQFRLDVENRDGFHFRLQHLRCGPGVSVSRLAFHADVFVEIDRVNAYMVQMPLAGRNDLRLGGERGTRHLLNNRLFSVIGPERSLRQRRSPDCDMVLVRFSAAHLAGCLAAHVGDGAAGDDFDQIEFAVEMPVRGLSSSPWARLTSYLVGELDKASGLLASPLAAAQAGQLLMSSLLLHQPHNYAALVRSPAAQCTPRLVREAEDFLECNAADAITVDDVARHLGISTRSLFAGFRRHLGVTPMRRLKDIRLAHVREDLLAANGDAVTVVATRWGFTHLGKFSSEYRARYGELPSETLKAASSRR
jgi:AraC-like DNA-binding protein